MEKDDDEQRTGYIMEQKPEGHPPEAVSRPRGRGPSLAQLRTRAEALKAAGFGQVEIRPDCTVVGRTTEADPADDEAKNADAVFHKRMEERQWAKSK